MMANYKADLDKIVDTAHAQIDLAASVIRAAIEAEEKLSAFNGKATEEATEAVPAEEKVVEAASETKTEETPKEEAAPAEAAQAKAE